MISTKLYAVPGKLFTVSIPEEQIGKVFVSYQYDLYLVPICVHFCFTTHYFVSFKTFKYLIWYQWGESDQSIIINYIVRILPF